MLITNKGEILTLKMFILPFFFKGTNKEETTYDFKFLLHLFHKTTSTFKVTWELTPGRMLLTPFLLGPPPRGWWRHLHHLWGQLFHLFITAKARNH